MPRRNPTTKSLSLILALSCIALGQAEIRLPALISDHMMLQRQMPVHI